MRKLCVTTTSRQDRHPPCRRTTVEERASGTNMIRTGRFHRRDELVNWMKYGSVLKLAAKKGDSLPSFEYHALGEYCVFEVKSKLAPGPQMCPACASSLSHCNRYIRCCYEATLIATAARPMAMTSVAAVSPYARAAHRRPYLLKPPCIEQIHVRSHRL